MAVVRFPAEAGIFPPHSAKFKNVWNYTFTPPYVFMTSCLVKYRTHLHGMVHG